MIRLIVDPRTPQVDSLERAAEAIRRGEVVAIPTDTLYGIAANPFSAAAVRRVFLAKGRAEQQALPLIAADAEQVAQQIGLLPANAAVLARTFWPGPLTLIVPAPSGLVREVTAGTGTIGVRVPDHAVARELCRVSATMLTATSANISGQPPTSDPDAVVQTLEGKVDLLLDAGRTAGGPPSTVIDVTGDEVRLVRAGAVSWEDIERCLAEE
ncbi:MAG: L-threonylcarbamoyladenylate synthase [Vicinamibacterales bacterium]